MKKPDENENNANVINIEDYVPTGHENAVSREFLEKQIGASDRMIRRAISESSAPIINVGGGYFIPDMNDPVDVVDLRGYVLQEQARVKSLQDKIAEKFADLVPDLIPTQEAPEAEEPEPEI